MSRLERRRDQLSRSLTGLVDWTEADRLGGELAAAQADLDRAEERWLALAEEGDSR